MRAAMPRGQRINLLGLLFVALDVAAWCGLVAALHACVPEPAPVKESVGAGARVAPVERCSP